MSNKGTPSIIPYVSEDRSLVLFQLTVQVGSASRDHSGSNFIPFCCSSIPQAYNHDLLNQGLSLLVRVLVGEKGRDWGETDPGLRCRPGKAHSTSAHIPLRHLTVDVSNSRKAGQCDKDKGKNKAGWTIKVILPPIFCLKPSTQFAILKQIETQDISDKTRASQKSKNTRKEVFRSCLIPMKKPCNFTSSWLTQRSTEILNNVQQAR